MDSLESMQMIPVPAGFSREVGLVSLGMPRTGAQQTASLLAECCRPGLAFVTDALHIVHAHSRPNASEVIGKPEPMTDPPCAVGAFSEWVIAIFSSSLASAEDKSLFNEASALVLL